MTYRSAFNTFVLLLEQALAKPAFAVVIIGVESLSEMIVITAF